MESPVIDNLRRKIEEIIARYESLLAENGELSEKVYSYEKEIENKDKLIKELTQRLDKLQLISAFDGDAPEKADTKRKISHMIGEIDKCIAMLAE